MKFLNNIKWFEMRDFRKFCLKRKNNDNKPPITEDYSQQYLTFEVVGDDPATFSFGNDVQYSLDNGKTWRTLPAGENTPEGRKIMWKATGLEPAEYDGKGGGGIGGFSSTGNQLIVYGNVMSLIYGDGFIGRTDLPIGNSTFAHLFADMSITDAENLILPATTLTEYCYAEMFINCVSLVKAPQLPATTLAQYCYSKMFQGCNALTTIQSKLPATTLADYCYQYMFYGCTSLVNAPELPATILANYCYQYMFMNCTSLASSPELPATTLVLWCYNGMFWGCTSLTAAPELSATTLARGCYNKMFMNCTSLTTAPELPATTLVRNCYSQMFFNCTSLTTAPELPADTLEQECYNNMFNGCTSLNYIKCLAINRAFAENCTLGWLNKVAATGTFVKAATASWNIGERGVPGGWTIVDATD